MKCWRITLRFLAVVLAVSSFGLQFAGKLFAQAPGADALVAAYGFNEGAGTTTADLSGNQLTGTLTGATWSTNGRYGGAISFAGTAGWVTVSSSALLNLSTGMTVQAWVYPTALSSWRSVIIKERTGGLSYGLYGNSDTSRPAAYVNLGGSDVGTNGMAQLPLNTWTHLAATYNGATLRLYVNGTNVSTRTVSGSLVTSSNPLRIGGNSVWNEYFTGRIDEVRVYNRALSVAEIQAGLNAPLIVTVPNVVGLTQSAATAALTAAGLAVGPVTNASSMTVPAGSVISQNPTAGGQAAAGSVVNLLVSSGPPLVTVPNVVGLTQGAATAAIIAASLTVGTTADAYSTEVTPGMIISQNPVGNTQIPEGGAVNLVVSLGPPPIVEVPNVVGQTQSAASNTIAAADLFVGNITQASSLTVSAGLVISQNPVAGTQLSAGSAVALVISSGLPPVVVPNVVSQTQAAATSTITSAGLLIGNISNAFSFTVPDGSVISQSPAGGIQVAGGSAVNLIVSQGPPSSVAAPNVVNLTRQAATNAINNAGLVVGTMFTAYNASVPIGSIISQNPAAGSLVPLGGAVNLVVSGPRIILDTHNVVLDGVDGQGKIIPWSANPGEGYDRVMFLSWDLLKNRIPNDPANGLPVTYTHSEYNNGNLSGTTWPNNPAGKHAMLADSAVMYFAYSGDQAVINLVRGLLDHQLQYGTTPTNYAWARVPWSTAAAGSITYGNDSSREGVGVLEPDKVGELGYHGYLRFYQLTGNTNYRNAAISCADALAQHVRDGTAASSPWAFRVVAQTGATLQSQEYCSDVVAPIRLFDELIRLGLGNTNAYQTARQKAWTWLMTYPMSNNVWVSYFEDTGYDMNNLNQYNPGQTARYLLERPELDPDWLRHTTNLLQFVETTFGGTDNGEAGLQHGARVISEQTAYKYKMASHTSRFGAMNALLYGATGDVNAREKAYRSLNWSTYMCRTNGVVIEGPAELLFNSPCWFTDGHGDYVRHFMLALGAVPEWAPAGQNHITRSTTVIQSVNYLSNSIAYTTFDAASTETLRLGFIPGSVLVNGEWLPQRSDLSQAGWVFTPSNGVLRVRHDTGTNVLISVGPSPVPVPDVVGSSQIVAANTIIAGGLIVGVVSNEFSAIVPWGLVISQTPMGGAQVPQGSAINLLVSSGPPPVTVPDVVGQTEVVASNALIAANLVVGTISVESSATVPTASVISQNPIGGTQLPPGSAVNLVVSSGPPPVTVPDVVGETEAVAQGAIVATALVVGTTGLESSATVPAGSVISQSPIGGTQLPPGSAVNLVVSSGPPPVTVPDVVGQTEAAATNALIATNLELGIINREYSESVPVGLIIIQSPVGGTQVLPGSSVDLTVSSGPPSVLVPDLVGQTKNAATNTIVATNLTVGTIRTEFTATVPAKLVISQQPAAGLEVVVGSAVDLVVSAGPLPSIQFAQSAEQLILAWPTSAVGFTLVFNPDLATTNWSLVLPLPAVVGENYVVTNQPAAASGFFRLQQP